MKLSIKGLAITSGLVWSGCILTCGLINLASPRYAGRFLKLMSSVYPGYRNARTVPDVLVGAGYGLVDGAVGGAVFAALYNRFACEPAASRQARTPLASAPSSEAHPSRV
jgi:hypothetical protein